VASLKDARAGDLVFFHEPSGHRRDPSALKVNHVGLYLGDGRMVEAANPSADTRISEVSVEKTSGNPAPRRSIQRLIFGLKNI